VFGQKRRRRDVRREVRRRRKTSVDQVGELTIDVKTFYVFFYKNVKKHVFMFYAFLFLCRVFVVVKT